MIEITINPIWPDGGCGPEIASVRAPSYAAAMATAASRMASYSRAVLAAAAMTGADPAEHPFNADNPPAFDLTVVAA